MFSARASERRLQISGIFLLLALAVEVACLFGKGPLAFMLFAVVGVTLFFAGLLLYLYLLLTSVQRRETPPSNQ